MGVLDLENQRLADEVGGWKNAHLMRVSVTVLYNSATERFEDYTERDMKRLIKRLAELDLAVWASTSSVSTTLCSRPTPPRSYAPVHPGPLEGRAQPPLGFRLNLMALAQATLSAVKSADELQVVQWWREGRLTELAAYCRQDVALIRNLFRHAQRE